jgi:predicted MFS family arabinose efflux permease
MPAGAPATYRSLFAVGEFRVLFATLLMFVLGFEFEILGLSVLVYAQTRSAFWTALAFGMGFAPQVLGGALFTALADRLPPRLVIAAGLLTRAVPGLVIGLWPGLPVPAMLALVAAVATVTMRATISGNRQLLADRTVRGLLLAQWLPAWLVTGAKSLIVPYAGSLGLPASAASPLLAATPAGMLLGDVIVGRFCRPPVRRLPAFPLAVAMGVPLLALAFRPSLPLAGLIMFGCGVGFAYALGIQQAFLDSLPAGLRGQAFGLNSTRMMTGQGLVPPVAGGRALAFGAGGAMAAAGAATVLAAVLLRAPLTGRAGSPAQVGAAGDVDDLPGQVPGRG